MKISIITEGYSNIGYGHITRCLSLYHAFEERNFTPKLFVYGDENSKVFLKDTRFEIVDWLNNFNKFLFKIAGSDVVVIDSYLAPLDFYERSVPITSIPVFIDDNMRLDYPAGIVINGTVNAELMPYAIKAGTTYLLGTKYVPLRKDFWFSKEKLIKPDIQTVLITFGGQDLQNMTPRMLKMFTRNFPDLKKIVVVGSGFNNLAQINEVKDENTVLHISPSASEMFRMMLDCDVAISGAGQTIYELAHAGTPTIAIRVADNQKNNISGWIKEEFLTADFNNETINLENRLQLVFNNYKKRDLRMKIAAIGKKKVDGLGAKRIAQEIIDQTISKLGGFYLRSAKESDAMSVFNLSNDRVVRGNSINQTPIKWKEHLEWYTSKINDPNVFYLLAFNASDEFMGQVRFDIKNNQAVVSISLNKDFRGKGFSTSLLLNSSFRCFHEKPEVEHIIGYIKSNNTPSIKSFLKATYFYSHDETITNEKYLVYKMANQS